MEIEKKRILACQILYLKDKVTGLREECNSKERKDHQRENKDSKTR
jgi:hypothetical protein